MIDIRKLKELVRLMVANELTELDLRDSEEQVSLRRATPGGAPTLVAAPSHAPPAVASPVEVAAAAPPGEGAESADAGLHKIVSPMVGTYYAAANPDSAPFIKVGDSVDEQTNVCIIEAMKIFNEIQAECSGTIEKILVKNGDPVEFGQPMFLVKTD